MKTWSILANKKLLEQTVKESNYKKDVLEKLGFTTRSGNYKTLDKFIEKYNIDISHFLTPADSIKGNEFRKKWEFEDIFKLNSPTKLGNTERKRILLKKELIEERCSLCGQGKEWKGKELSFILDHKNGNKKDDRVENLRLICPNCDSTLPTYMGRNAINPKSKRQRDIRKQKEKEFKKQLKLKKIKEKLINSGIDFSKKTWGVEVAILLDKSPQYSLKFVKKNFPKLIN